jgi:hypothetical protein
VENGTKVISALERNGSRVKRFREPKRSDVDEALLKWFKGPHTRTVLPSVLTSQLITAQLDRECVGNSVRQCS